MAGASKTQKTLREELGNKAVPLTGGTGKTFKWDTPGARLDGRFMSLREGSMGGEMVTLDTGKELVTASAPTMLADALRTLKVGTRVVIRYNGEEVGKNGQTYKSFEAVALTD